MSESLLHISNLTLEFDIYGKEQSFRSRWASRLRLGDREAPQKLRALDDVSLQVQRGERLAIMGHNGAGKSSLLKVIAGVYPIRQGRVELRGSIAPLIELGAGFNPHLSARRNIVLNGAMFGYTRREMLEKTPDILEFAGLTEFAEVPLRNYSTGMRRRLAFTIATDMRPDLLIIDEIFAGGDLQFVGRARARMQDLLGRANALIMVSHNLNLLEQFCERGIWLDHGTVRSEGPVAEVAAAYRASVPQPAVIAAPASEAEQVAEAELETGEGADALPLEDDLDVSALPFVVDPRDRLSVRFPPECWERSDRCHCRGVLTPGPHPGWQVCRRCRSWVNTNRLTEAAALSLARYAPALAGVYPPGWARLSDGSLRVELQPLVEAAKACRANGADQPRALQLGCAGGGLLLALREQGWEVAGLEQSSALLVEARQQLGECVDAGGVKELGAEQCDVLVCVDYLSRMHDPGAALSGMKRSLRRGGVLLLCEAIFDEATTPLHGPAALLSRVMYNYLFSRGGLESLAHASGFVNISEQGSWNDWPILILR
ncbi:MAG: ATP-binding cassette domain-containing protein [Phycisphaerales bacterium JB038]